MKELVAFLIVSLISFCYGEGETPQGVEIQFVLAAKGLPLLILGRKPDAFVEVTYFRSPDVPTPTTPFSNKTVVIPETPNPEWPDVFQVTYFEGHGQKLRFVIKHSHDEIGKLTLSVSDLLKAPEGKLERDIVGKNFATKGPAGHLLISTMVNGTTNDDTDLRLVSGQKEEAIKILKRTIETID